MAHFKPMRVSVLGTELQGPRGMDVTPRGQSPPSPRVQTAVPSFFFISQFSSFFFCLFLTSCYEILQTYRPRKNCTLDAPVPAAPFSHLHRPRVLYDVCVRLHVALSVLLWGAFLSHFPCIYSLASYIKEELSHPHSHLFMFPGRTVGHRAVPAFTAALPP